MLSDSERLALSRSQTRKSNGAPTAGAGRRHHSVKSLALPRGAGGLSDHLLQFAVFAHFHDDVTTADQLAVDPQLRKGGPVAVLREAGTDVGIAQHIEVGKALATGHQRLHGAGREAALRLIGRLFYVKIDGVVFDLFTDGI